MTSRHVVLLGPPSYVFPLPPGICILTYQVCSEVPLSVCPSPLDTWLSPEDTASLVASQGQPVLSPLLN